MEPLMNVTEDKEGYFVFLVSPRDGRGISVRRSSSTDNEYKTETVFKNGEMVSVCLIRPSLKDGGKDGPFLRLSDDSGWLFAKKAGALMMKNLPLSVGLWCFFVDNCRGNGIALRRHPVDRPGQCDMKVPYGAYEPMQKIYCDRKVQNPTTGINFFRVQGTDWWVFDRRPSTREGLTHDIMLLDENMVETGVFVYECIHSERITIKRFPELCNSANTDISISPGQLICANAIRKSPYPHGNGPFLRVSDGYGWLYERIRHQKVMKPLPVNKGKWELKVVAPNGIGLRSQPIANGFFLYDKETPSYPPGEIIRGTHMVQSSSGVKFYRVEGTEGWVFDKRGDQKWLIDVSENSSFQDTGWSPDFVREIASNISGLVEVSFNEQSRVISFATVESNSIRINVYYTTRTIGTALFHPSQGATQLFRRSCTTEDLRNILKNQRAHTGKGYQRRVNDPSASRPTTISQTSCEKDLMLDREIELRKRFLEVDVWVFCFALAFERAEILQQIRDIDHERSNEAIKIKRKIDLRTQQFVERQKIANMKKAEAERKAEELNSRTCEVCSKVFQSRHAKYQHYNAVHVFDYPFCGKEFSNGHSLNQHQNALGHW